MNLSITNRCNNNCAFCFQHNNVGYREMSLDGASKILDWLDLKSIPKEAQTDFSIGILGGEPTIAPLFLNICRLIRDRNIHLHIMTNLLCEPEILKEFIYDNPTAFFLVNTIHSETNNDRFEKNLHILYSTSNQVRISLGVTLDNINDDKKINYLINLVKKENNKATSNIRISQAVPNYKYNIFDHSEFGNKVQKIIKNIHSVDPRIRFGFDCAVNMCLLKDNLYKECNLNQKFIQKHTRLQCYATHDIYPDFSSSFCSCFSDPQSPLFIKNIFDFKNLEALGEEYNNLLRKFWATNPLACNFKNCKHRECMGLCPGMTYVKNNQKELIKRRFKGK